MEDTAVVDTPSSSSSSAPAPSAPSPAPEPQATTDRPSFGEALDTFNGIRVAQGKKPRGMKDAPVPEAAPVAAAGTEPVPPVETPKPTPGPIPLAVHEQALKNARAKEREAAQQEFRQQYGDPAVAREAMQWFQSAARDRVGFLTSVINEALADPELAPQIASLAGRTLGNVRSVGPLCCIVCRAQQQRPQRIGVADRDPGDRTWPNSPSRSAHARFHRWAGQPVLLREAATGAR